MNDLSPSMDRTEKYRHYIIRSFLSIKHKAPEFSILLIIYTMLTKWFIYLRVAAVPEQVRKLQVSEELININCIFLILILTKIPFPLI